MRSLAMPILLPTSSFKTTATVLFAGIFSIAAAVSFTIPSVSHVMASCFLIVYDNTVFLVKPPYLYLVTNCIIVSIVATSKLNQKASAHIDDDPEFPQVVTPVPSDIDAGYLNVTHVVVAYPGFEESDAPVEDVPEVISDDNVKVDGREDQHAETQKPKPIPGSPEPETDTPKPITGSPEPEKPKINSDSPAVSVVKLSRKPPRFNQQKSLKNSHDADGGGSKKSKESRREDTLETTWKKITEGRSTPLKKHLTKSDTWQERSHVQKKEKMTKSENLNEAEETLRLKREPSPGQEELNRRVEAFIKKFNEEMRLQRLESLAKYNEMVN